MMGVFCMFSGIILMSICVIIIGGNFEQAHQNMLTDKAKMKQKPQTDPAVKNINPIKPKSDTLPERQVSHIFEHTDPAERSQSGSLNVLKRVSTVFRMQGQDFKGTSRNLMKKFGDLDMRISHLESEAEKAINGAGSQFP